MIILYVPFPREHAGDLPDLVSQWQINHKKNSSELLSIIYQNDNFDQELIEPLTSVYICVHGEDNSLRLGNHRDIEKAQFISSAVLAERFNNDFLPVAHQISRIHLYCCGNHDKNKTLALSFKKDLLRRDAFISFYNGAITIHDASGHRWSFGGRTTLPVDDTMSHLSTNWLDSEEDESPFERLSLKERDHLLWSMNARLKRREDFFERQKMSRHALHAFFRNKHSEDEFIGSSPAAKLNNG